MRLTQKRKDYLAKILSDRVCFTLPEQFNNIIDNKDPNEYTIEEAKSILEEIKTAMYLLDDFAGTDRARSEYEAYEKLYKQWLKNK